MKGAVIVAFLASASLASASSEQGWKDVGDYGGPAFWLIGLGSSLVQDGHLGLAHAARTFDGFIVSYALNEAVSYAVREKRPYTDAHDSFPSTHATLSFEVAAAQSYYHPHQALFWYGAASLISYSRIPAHDHYWQDVISGAALGYGSGQLSVSGRRGWIFAPIVENGHLGGMAMVSGRF